MKYELNNIGWIIIFQVSFVTIYPQGSHAQQSVRYSDTSHVAYCNINRVIDLPAKKYKCEDLILSVDNGEITSSNDSCHYIFKPKEKGIANILVRQKIRSEEKIIKRIQYNVLMRPLPTPHLFLPKEHIEPGVERGIQIYLTDSLGVFNKKYRVVDYEIELVRNKKIIGMNKNRGAVFEIMTKQLLDDTQKGDIVRIKNVHYIIEGTPTLYNAGDLTYNL